MKARRPIIQDLPKPNLTARNLSDGPPTVLTNDDAYTVGTWSPGRADENVPATMVHLILEAKPITVTLRLKSARALDELVGVLLQYRKEVWPNE